MKTISGTSKPRVSQITCKHEGHSVEKSSGTVKHPLRVLHLEDNAIDAELVRSLLEVGGYSPQMAWVQTRAEFSAAVETKKFDLILSDYSLPAYDGKSALRLARRVCPDTPFIFVSGTLGEDAAIDSLKEGATDYVVKNRLNRLGPAIQRLMRERQEQQKRKEAEKHARQGDALFRQITENATDLIAVLDLDGNWLYTSSSYRAILDESVLQPGMDSLSQIHPEDRPRMREVLRRVVRNSTSGPEEFRFLVKNRSMCFIEAQFSTIRNEDGAVENIVSVSRDVTERKRAEEQMARIHAELEQTNHDLHRRNEEIQNFYHTLSHELKTPLTAAREFISIVMDGLAGPLTETQTEYLNIAKDSCNQLRVCINDLLDAARLDTGKMCVEFKPACLGPLIQQVVTILAPVALKKKIELINNVQPDLPQIPIDANRIVQVITNLLNNALKFTPENGKIILELKEAPGRSDRLQVSIRDTGRGIPKEQLERIFDRLYQVKLGDATTEQGIGLGLYICRELVELHGGHIRVDSELGKGSTFIFDLPKQPHPNQLTVLVVDDEPSMLEAVRRVLEKAEFHVVSAQGGAEALQWAQPQPPDVIILDLEMPEPDGASTLKAIRERWGSLPVIVYTGYPDSDSMTRALESSPFTCLCKPCSDSQLIETVRLVQFQSNSATKKPQLTRILQP